MIYQKLLMPLKLKENLRKYQKFEELITLFRIRYIDIRMDTYLKNIDEFQEKFFSLDKIVLF